MITYKQITDLNSIRNLWNEELGFIFPMSVEVLNQNITNYANKFVLGAYDEDRLVGFVVGKRDISEIESYKNLGWINLIYVDKDYRRKGIGSKLLTEVENYLSGVSTINVGKDINNFFPGSPSEFAGTSDTFFIKRGYIDGGQGYDVINTNLKKIELRNKEFKYMACTMEHKDALIKFFEKNFPGRWEYEARDYFAKGGNGDSYVICLDGDKVIGFSRMNDRKDKVYPYNTTWFPRFNNLGGVGPLGVDRDYRKKDIGFDVVAFGINTLIDRGITEIIIDWTGLLNFYRQFGFEVWKDFKYLSKKG